MRRGAVFALVVFVMSLANVAPLAAQVDGLSYGEETVFTIGDGVVTVETIVTMTNTTSDRRDGNTIFYSFFDTMPLLVPVGATNLEVTSRGASLSGGAVPIDQEFELHEFSLPSQLRSGQSRIVTITYDLPAGDPRSNGLFHSNAAYASFPLWSLSDPGQGSMELHVPNNVELNDVGRSLRLSRDQTSEGFTIYEPVDFEVPSELFAYVVVTDESRLETRAIEVAGQNIEINYWPGDDVWAGFAERTIQAGLPALEDVIGLSVPDQETLQVNESATPYFFGYGGWYDALNTSIDIGNVLDETVMIHELSHGWFNNELFLDRWILEGLAEDFTWRAQGEIGSPQEVVPSAPSTSDRGAQPLSEWVVEPLSATDSEGFTEREEYGYRASWYVLRSITETIGLDDMQGVLGDAAANRQPYSASQYLVQGFGQDWRRLLDLVAEYASPDEQDAVEALFIEYVVTSEFIEEFETRDQARIDYQLLAEREPGWQIPLSIRNAMAQWDFDSAQSQLGEARSIQDRYLQVQSSIEGTNIELSNAPEKLYEDGPNSWDDALELLDDQFAAVGITAALEERANTRQSLRERIGLIGTDASGPIDDAHEALRTDDFESVAAASAQLNELLADAERNGSIRLGVGSVVSLSACGVWVVNRWQRRRKSSTPEASKTFEGEDALAFSLGLLEEFRDPVDDDSEVAA